MATCIVLGTGGGGKGLVIDAPVVDIETGFPVKAGQVLYRTTNFTWLGNPAALPAGVGYGCTFSPDGNYLAVAHNSTPFITIYKRSGDTFTKLGNPAALPAGQGNCCTFSPDGNYLAVAHATTSPFITIYKRSGDTFTKLDNPHVLPTGTGYSCAFSPDGNYLAVGHQMSPSITIYKISKEIFESVIGVIADISIPLKNSDGNSPVKANIIEV